MATSQISEVIQHLGRTVLLWDGAGLTDGQLLESFISRREEAAVAALVRRHGPMVWGVCRRFLSSHQDAEDAFQATFLVFLRKAASIIPREMVANWLFGVARQTALKAKQMAAKRSGRERQVIDMPEPKDIEEDRTLDLHLLLDQELSRLPDKYRCVIVLCDLQGKTRKEAARQLGVPEGTIASRMATARTKLAKRLARHGLAVSGASLTAALSQNMAAAAVPTPVLASTIKAVTMVAAGETAATGLISANVAAVTEGVVKSMLLTKLKTMTALLLMLSMVTLTTAMLAWGRTGGNGTSGEKPAAKADARPNDAEGDKEQTLKVTIKAQAKRFGAKESFKVDLRVVNSSKLPQSFQVMSCSWHEHWKSSNVQVGWQGWPCARNSPIDVKLAPGEAYEKTLSMLLVGGKPQEKVTFKMGFTPIGSKQTYWSNEVSLHVEPDAKATTQAPPDKDPPKDFINSLGMKFVWIPPGSFLMGSPKEENQRGGSETQHKVTLSKGFYMGVHTVTQEQWKEVMGNSPSHFKGDKNLPVDSVSWDDCQEFIKKLREKDKKLYRLPTESEWEFCCRAGTTTPFHFGQTISTDQANYYGEAVYGDGKNGVFRKKTTPVGSFPANAWGLHDMHGNVWQWCQDWHGDYPQNDVVDPQGPNEGQYRVMRGGSWGDGPVNCRSAHRFGFVPGGQRSHVGCRLCFSVEQESDKQQPPPDKNVKGTAQAQPKDPPKDFTNRIGMKFAWIPPGSFMMGGLIEERVDYDETQHKVTLSRGFYMSVYTVTQEQWQEVMSKNPSQFKGEKNLPVEKVSWDDCQEFIKKLREKDRKPYRLPSEAEWEYSCRAGSKTPFHFGETISTDQANYNGKLIYGDGKEGVYRQKTTPVGTFPANAWGLHDMHGNVGQWCQDWYGDYPKNDVTDPQGPEKAKYRVLRGGFWFSDPECCRSAFRHRGEPGHRDSSVGCRVCFFVE